jgi:hypothetical protein
MKNAVCCDLDSVAANIGIGGMSTRTQSGLTDLKDMYVCQRSIGNETFAGISCYTFIGVGELHLNDVSAQKIQINISHQQEVSKGDTWP